MRFIHAVVFDKSEFIHSDYDTNDWSDLINEDYIVHCLYSEDKEEIIYLEDNIHAPIETIIASFLEGIALAGESVSVTKVYIVVDDGLKYRKDAVGLCLAEGAYEEVK